MKGFLTQRLGPLPLWTWFLIFVGAVYLFLRYRGTKGQKASTVEDADNLTAQQATLIPWSTDVFINVPQSTVPYPPNVASKYGYGNVAGGALRTGGPFSVFGTAGRNPGPLPPGTGSPRPRVTSVTYQQPAYTQPAQAGGLGALFGYTGAQTRFRSQPLVIPT